MHLKMPTMSIEWNEENNIFFFFYFISSKKVQCIKKISTQKYARKPKEPADFFFVVAVHMTSKIGMCLNVTSVCK